MLKRLAGLLILIIILISILVPNSLSADETPWWNKSWSFKEEIIIPIDTKDDTAKYQPIDINLKFNNSCWAINEEEYSIRVIFESEEKFIELESQIYDLNHTDAEHIDSCNLVFLIPQEANGNEKYYVYYDEERKPSPNYQKHVNVEESYYRYEPIQGLLFDSSFYKIIEEGYVVYGINKEGSAMGTHVSQQATKLKKGSKDTMPNSIENMASFNLVYWWYKDGEWYPVDSSEKLISSQIFVNGNLMIKLGIVSQSNDGLIQTTAIYKYYYCPTENKRIYTHVREEIIKYPLPTGSEIDVAYVTLHCGGVKSSAIHELNFGNIPPYLHFYSDKERILTQEIDQYPEGTKWQKVIGKKDDYDLGSSPWVSVDYGETGKAHAIIFETNKILKSGDYERDGIELQLYESQNIQYTGLDGRMAELYICRNAYEKDDPADELLPKNYAIEFNAEYFTTENGGYPAVEKEASAYQKLVSYQPKNENNVTGGDEKEQKEKYSLTTYVHFASSVPMGSLLSAALGKNLSYTYAELYKDGNFKSSGSVNRLPLGKIELDFKDKNLFQKLKTLLDIFDWKNLSFFKKIKFPDLEPGTYVVKIYRENQRFAKERQYIGFGIIDLQKDDSIRIFCKSQGTINVTVLNQENKGMENVKILLQMDNTTIADATSDKNGSAILKAPCYGNKPYTLKIIYQGFLVDEEKDIRLGLLRRLIPLKKTIEFDIHDLKVSFKDSDGKVPSFNLNLDLTSDEMQEPVEIRAEDITDGTYTFKGLYPANYNLKINYNLFEIKEKISVPDMDSLTINLYDFTAYIKDSWNLNSEVPLDVSLTSKDLEKTAVISGGRLSDGEYIFSELYPGDYMLRVSYKEYTIEQSVSILNNGKIEIEFPALYNVATTVLDARGNPLKDAKVLMIRDGEEIQGTTDKDGNVILSVPPGVYVSEIYYKGELIAERKVNVLNERSCSVVTTSQPMTPFIIIGLSITLLIGAAILSYRKKELMFFLQILAIVLIIIAIFSPWWTVQGSSTSPHFETSTNLYLVPVKMVTMTSNENVTAGELVSLDEKFVSVITLLTLAIGFSMLGVVAGMIINRYKKYKTSLLVFLFTIIVLIGSIAVFFYAMSELANVTVGSLTGGANLDVSIPGANMYETMSCCWSLNLGFYLLLGAIVVLMLVFCLNLRGIISKKIK